MLNKLVLDYGQFLYTVMPFALKTVTDASSFLIGDWLFILINGDGSGRMHI